jgi:hypothetical protein
VDYLRERPDSEVVAVEEERNRLEEERNRRRANEAELDDRRWDDFERTIRAMAAKEGVSVGDFLRKALFPDDDQKEKKS